MLRRSLCAGAAVALLAVVTAVPAQRADALRPTVFALRDARVVTEPGKVLDRATVVVRDGLIEAVGADVQAPADALVMDCKGLTVYPGFVDGLCNRGFDDALRRSAVGAPEPVDLAAEALATTKADNRKGVTPEFLVSTALKDDEQADSWRRLGLTAALVAPDGGIIVGQSALVSLSGAPPRDAVLRPRVAQHVAFRPLGGSDYPRVLMGIVAHCRQTFLDAGFYGRTAKAYEDGTLIGRRPPLDPALEQLGLALGGKQPVIFEADTRDEIHRALDFAAEFKLRPIIYGGRDAWKAADRLKAENVPVILRINFTEGLAARGGRGRGFRPPTTPNQPATPGTPQTRGRRGQRQAPTPDATPGGPQEQQPPDLPARVREDRLRQQKEEQHNAAVLSEKGVRFALSSQGQTGNQPWEKFRENLRKAITAGLKPEAALRALTTDAAGILGADKQLGSIAPRKAAHLVVTDGDFEKPATKVRYVFADGVRFDYTGPAPTQVAGGGRGARGGRGGGPMPMPKPEEAKPDEAKAPDQVTEIESDRKPRLHTGGNVLLRGATVVTVTKGTQPETDVLVLKGKIVAVGKGVAAPDGVTVIDARGTYVLPGIIDTHCHFAVSGGVNEFSLSVVPEVRVRDVINSEDVQIYRALAGGVTTARLLHGSANVIGGQDAVIKLKYGEDAKKLLLADAPRGVKFALGENVKRTDGRFPNTRLGVEAVLIRSFTEAKEYARRQEAYRKAKAEGKAVAEPRRDLRLEALADVLRGDLKVHCHCYRADEILMLLRVADRFGFKVQSLQHVLEGYKIAPEIAKHGATCSPFSDWWAYKLEAYDAIPFNAALLTEAGVTVCLKSDSNELMRHLYQEAAKVVKYGGMSEEEALKTITLNGAKQLGLDKRVGSIEEGKDGDFAVFNGHPLNSYSRVEMTLVEGEVYFQRSDTLKVLEAAKAPPAKPRPALKRIEVAKNGCYIIDGATVHPVVGPVLPNARVLIKDGKIVEIAREGAKFESEQTGTVVDARGLHLYPGMIDAGTVLGLTEVGSARETQDYAEGGDFQPDLRASTGINPDSELIPVTRANGVTTVVTRPAGAIVAGQSALINLAGWVPREMAVVDPLALHVEFPSTSMRFGGGNADAIRLGRAINRRAREEKVRRLKELFQQAVVYDKARKESPDRPTNPRLEALVPYARGERPVVIQASGKQDILEALKLADELKLKVVLSGGTEAWKVASELKKRNVPVIVGPVMALPSEQYDPYDGPYACAAKLHEAGVPFCIRSAGTTNTRNLPYEAAMAVSYGLPPEEGLKAVTLYPAQILGVDRDLGSISKGKRANLVLTNGDILQASTQVAALFIDGRPLEPTSKHTRLYERYRERLREVREGRSPLGTK